MSRRAAPPSLTNRQAALSQLSWIAPKPLVDGVLLACSVVWSLAVGSAFFFVIVVAGWLSNQLAGRFRSRNE